MSIHHLEAAAELDIHATRKLVLMALADDANKVTRVTYPEREKLIVWSGAQERRVAQIIDELIALQLIARRRFGQPGARAEFVVFPTAEELEALDERNAALNNVSPSTLQRLHDEEERDRQKAARAAAKAAEKAAAKASTEPVDNPEDVGATDCTHTDPNGCNFGPNGCNSYFTPPVITSRLVNQSSENVTIELAVDNSDQDEKKSAPRKSPSPASMPHHLDDINLDLIWDRCKRILEPTGINSDELRELARRVVAKCPVRVLNPTNYVIRAIRLDEHEWQAEAHAIAAGSLGVAAERAGNDF
jgi:hypothetical protein